MPSSPTLLDVFNSFTGLAGSVLDAADEKVRRQSQIDVMYAQSEFDRAATEELIKLQNDPANFADWSTKMDEFIEQQRVSLTSNPDYSGLTIHQIDAMLNTSRDSLQAQVSKMFDARQRENNLIKMQTEVNNNSQAYSGQERVQKNDEILFLNYQNGVIDETTYRNLAHSELANAAQSLLAKTGENAVDYVIQNGGDWSEVEAAIRGTDLDLKSLHTGDTLTVTELDTLRDSVVKSASAIYNAKINDIQNKNNGRLSEEWLNCNRLDGIQQYQAARNALTLMATDMTGLNLDSNVRDKYTNYFTGIVEGWENAWANAGTSSGSGKSSALDNYSTLLDATPETYWAACVNGEMPDLQTAEMVAGYRLSQEWVNGEYKENQGKSADERRLYYEDVYAGPISDSFNELLKKHFKTGDPVLGGLYDAYKRLEKEVLSAPGTYDDQALTNLNAFVLDCISSNKLGDASCLDQIQKYINTCIYTATRSEILFGMEPAKSVYTDSEIADVADAVFNNDVVFTDRAGNEVWAPGVDRTAIQATLRYGVAKTLGVNTGAVSFVDWTRSDNDMTPVPVFEAGGHQYRVEPTYNNRGKVSGYQVMDITEGGYSRAFSVNDAASELANAQAASRQTIEEAKAARKQVWDDWKVSEQEILAKYDTYKTEPPAIDDYFGLKVDWAKEDAFKKRDDVRELIEDLDEKEIFEWSDKSTFEALGFTIGKGKNDLENVRATWNTFTPEQKETLVLGLTTLDEILNSK